jgi:hypothetical protein
MAGKAQLLEAACDGRLTRYSDLISLTESLGFIRSTNRTRGSHHCKFTYPGWRGLLLYQPQPGGKAKPYQVRQLLKAMEEIGIDP